MDWQQLVSLVIVFFAAAALGWGRWRRRKLSFARATRCGCPPAGGTAPEQSSILFHARKGGPSRVVVKMK